MPAPDRHLDYVASNGLRCTKARTRDGFVIGVSVESPRREDGVARHERATQGIGDP